MATAIVLFAHGSRDPAWAEPFANIRARIQSRLPEVSVKLAFLELMQPTLSDAVAELVELGVQQVTLMPMFLARGGHLKQDLPRLMADIHAQYPHLRLQIAPAIGEVDTVLQHLADWVCEEHQAAACR